MKDRLNKPILFRTILITGLFLIAVSITGLGISCQSQEPASAPPVPSPGLPTAPTPGEPTVMPPQIEVAIEDFAFKPAEITIPVGTTVIWYNNDSVVHTATARDNSFDSGSLSQGDMFSYTFEQKGTFEYYCIPHPYMTGIITVE